MNDGARNSPGRDSPRHNSPGFKGGSAARKVGQHADDQLTLFPGGGSSAAPVLRPGESGQGDVERGGQAAVSRTIVVNPHLLAARRIARRMRRIKDRDAETRAGLAICAQLKAYLQDDPSRSPSSRH